MRDPSSKNMSASIRARLLNLAKARGEDFQAIVLRYAVERFLARLAASPHRDQFVLKGAMLYIAWRLDDKRTTMDLDLLGFGNPDPKHLAKVIASVCSVTVENDGLVFDGTRVAASPIREDSVYDGVRVVVPVHLGVMPIRLQIDVGFGDAIVPEPRQVEFPALLAEHGPTIATYSPESVIAEKLHAMALLGMANSRMKDYFDIWMMSRTLKLNDDLLREAIKRTFARRQTPLPASTPVGLTDAFGNNESKRLQWAGFVKRQRRESTPPDLLEVVKTVREFLVHLGDNNPSST